MKFAFILNKMKIGMNSSTELLSYTRLDSYDHSVSDILPTDVTFSLDPYHCVSWNSEILCNRIR